MLEILRDVPGLTVIQSGSRGATTSIFTRGGNADMNQVLIDGMKVNLGRRRLRLRQPHDGGDRAGGDRAGPAERALRRRRHDLGAAVLHAARRGPAERLGLGQGRQLLDRRGTRRRLVGQSTGRRVLRVRPRPHRRGPRDQQRLHQLHGGAAARPRADPRSRVHAHGPLRQQRLPLPDGGRRRSAGSLPRPASVPGRASGSSEAWASATARRRGSSIGSRSAARPRPAASTTPSTCRPTFPAPTRSTRPTRTGSSSTTTRC